jgi:hypothetical protein
MFIRWPPGPYGTRTSLGWQRPQKKSDRPADGPIPYAQPAWVSRIISGAGMCERLGDWSRVSASGDVLGIFYSSSKSKGRKTLPWEMAPSLTLQVLAKMLILLSPEETAPLVHIFSTLNRWPSGMPGGGLLVCMRHLQQEPIIERPSRQLQPDGQFVALH